MDLTLVVMLFAYGFFLSKLTNVSLEILNRKVR